LLRAICATREAVEDCVVVELKSVERLHPVYSAHVITYLKLTGCPAGLLLNFNATTLCAGIKRLDHPDRYTWKPPDVQLANPNPSGGA
jgi:hypothetical protein